MRWILSQFLYFVCMFFRLCLGTCTNGCCADGFMYLQQSWWGGVRFSRALCLINVGMPDPKCIQQDKCCLLIYLFSLGGGLFIGACLEEYPVSPILFRFLGTAGGTSSLRSDPGSRVSPIVLRVSPGICVHLCT